MGPSNGRPCTQRKLEAESRLINSGQADIDAFKKSIALWTEFHVQENAGLLQASKKKKFANCTIGANPLASFPNDHTKAGAGVK